MYPVISFKNYQFLFCFTVARLGLTKHPKIYLHWFFVKIMLVFLHRTGLMHVFLEAKIHDVPYAMSSTCTREKLSY
jgi:orotidine-5'-phosphate decarboxylase